MTELPSSVVIVGGGLAGAKTAEAVRAKGFAGPVTVIAAEDELPYERPPLSKSYLLGKDPFDKAVVHPASWYAEHQVDLMSGRIATSIEREAQIVELDDGSRVGYGALVLATGSEPRALPVPGADAAGVLTLRTRADSDAIRATFGEDRALVIIGAGWIGLEVAAAAREAGTAVAVVEAADQPLLAAIGPDIAPVFADLHRAHGVDLRLGASVDSILVEDGRAVGVRLGDGTDLAADAIVVGIGARPRTSLAEAAGLEVDNGVLVDASLRTSDPAIFAVGDIANHDHPLLRKRVRVEHWAAALNQPKAAAAALLGEDAVYAELPYFFSDQYDLGMEYVGLADSYARLVIRGDVANREFVAFWLDDANRLLAAMNVNVWDVPDAVKPLIKAGTVVDPDRLADPSVAYADL
jgi:3-phenylpropionate/trans-cinnamate dioxygenase ferredoxin reductase subunit